MNENNYCLLSLVYQRTTKSTRPAVAEIITESTLAGTNMSSRLFVRLPLSFLRRSPHQSFLMPDALEDFPGKDA
jgi:hypothetical protein